MLTDKTEETKRESFETESVNKGTHAIERVDQRVVNGGNSIRPPTIILQTFFIIHSSIISIQFCTITIE